MYASAFTKNDDSRRWTLHVKLKELYTIHAPTAARAAHPIPFRSSLHTVLHTVTPIFGTGPSDASCKKRKSLSSVVSSLSPLGPCHVDHVAVGMGVLEGDFAGVNIDSNDGLRHRE